MLEKTKTLLGSVKGIVGILIPVVFGLAILLFFWGIVKFIWSEGGGKEDGKKIMLWGVIAIFVMSSIWGLVAFIEGTFGIDKTTNANIPTINRSGGSSGGGCVDGYNAQGTQDGC